MRHEAHIAPLADRLSAAFEHSITWEDDIWRADPVDVELVHANARRKYADLLDAVTATTGASVQARILLFHGQSGAGKTHLIRALRTVGHRSGKAYFGYAQMTPDVANYADYYLRRLIASLERPYDPDHGGGSGLARLAKRMAGDAEVVEAAAVDKLRDGKLGDAALAKLVLSLADQIVAAPKFAGQGLDVNVVRALLYMQRSDPRIDQRVRQYLYGQKLGELSHEAVAALDPHPGEGRAFDIVESIGRLVWAVDRAALVFAIDQVEDLRFFDDYQERFQRAVRDLIQIANRVPTSIVLISCLADFYGKAREVLTQSYIDRIEKAGPVPLIETRTAEEARLIIAKRLAQDERSAGGDPTLYLGPQFFEEFGGLSTRRILELAQKRMREQEGDAPEEPPQGRAASSRRWPRPWASVAAGRRRPQRPPGRRPPWSTASTGSASSPSRRPRSRATTRVCAMRSPARSRSPGRSGAMRSMCRCGVRARPTTCPRSISRCCMRPAAGRRPASSCATGRPRAAGSSARSTASSPP